MMAAKSLATDVVVVGAGAAGLLAATAARQAGFEVTVVEATGVVGGSTATDTGHVWLPGHPFGKHDVENPSDVAAYLDAALGPVTPASSRARRDAFVASAPEVGAWLLRQNVVLAGVRNRPDLHPTAPGARASGRVVASGPVDRRPLGPWADRIRTSGYGLEIAPRSPRGLLKAAQTMAHRVLSPTRQLVQGGSGLVAQLLLAATRSGATLWLDTPMLDVIAEDGRAAGVRIRRDGADVDLLANTAVVLACGGFEANDDLRREYLPLPTDAAWSAGYVGNTGAGITAAARLGAPLEAMDDAWWTLVALFDGIPFRMTLERSLPFGIIVDAAGDRFVDEAGPMPEIGRHLYERNRRVRAVPSWLIVDNRHRQRYPLGPWLPGSAPGRDDESLVRADSLDELATDLGIDRAGLLGTVVRFNQFAAKHRDTDFGRGSSVTDRANGDPTVRKNPNLGPLERAPFWAVPLYPGDTGTKGGVVVDADARVLGPDGTPLLTGLFATTGTAASLFPKTGTGHGAALASALIDAYRAVSAIADGRVGSPQQHG